MKNHRIHGFFLLSPCVPIRKSGISEFRVASVRMCPGDPRKSRSRMDTRPGNGRCDNLVCTVGVYLNFIGGLAVTWVMCPQESGGGDAAGGSFFALSDRGRDDAPPVFPRGHFRPTNIAPLPPSLRPSRFRPVSTPVQPSNPPPPFLFIHPPPSILFLSFSLTLSRGASNIFLSSRNRP